MKSTEDNISLETNAHFNNNTILQTENVLVQSISDLHPKSPDRRPESLIPDDFLVVASSTPELTDFS